MYFEEFEVGQKYQLEPVTLTLEGIKKFASKYDPLPIHIDSNFAQKSKFNGIIASGFQTLCIIWGQWVRQNKIGTEVIAGIGIDYLNWLLPVYPDDCLSGEVEVIDLIPSSKGGKGVLVSRITAYNQNNKKVLVVQFKSLIKSKN